MIGKKEGVRERRQTSRRSRGIYRRGQKSGGLNLRQWLPDQFEQVGVDDVHVS
jgi:hypothetical protein